MARAVRGIEYEIENLEVPEISERPSQEFKVHGTIFIHDHRRDESLKLLRQRVDYIDNFRGSIKEKGDSKIEIYTQNFTDFGRLIDKFRETLV